MPDSIVSACSVLDGVSVLNIIPKFLIVPKARESTGRTALLPLTQNVKVSDQN